VLRRLVALQHGVGGDDNDDDDENDNDDDRLSVDGMVCCVVLFKFKFGISGCKTKPAPSAFWRIYRPRSISPVECVNVVVANQPSPSEPSLPRRL
jgi:hypothetical protein